MFLGNAGIVHLPHRNPQSRSITRRWTGQPPRDLNGIVPCNGHPARHCASALEQFRAAPGFPQTNGRPPAHFAKTLEKLRVLHGAKALAKKRNDLPARNGICQHPERGASLPGIFIVEETAAGKDNAICLSEYGLEIPAASERPTATSEGAPCFRPGADLWGGQIGRIA